MVKHHILDIYGTHLHLATTKAEWRKLRRHHKWLSKTPDSMGLSWFHAGTPPHLVLWIDVKRHGDRGELVDTAAHEATHAAGSIFEHIGHAHPGIDEPHAYLVGWLTRWIYDGCA